MKREKIDINGSISNSVKGIAGDTIGLLVVAIIFGCLFAPVFATIIEGKLMRKPNGCFINMIDMPDVWRKMVFVKIALWIVCIIAWTAVFLLNVHPEWAWSQ
jgi:hypothetical protein